MPTKAQNLFFLKDKIQHAVVLDLIFFTLEQYYSGLCFTDIENFCRRNTYFIVRSSGVDEDQENASNAGRFKSFLNVASTNIISTINEVIESFGSNPDPKSEILIQPMLENVEISGVLFTKNPNNSANYYIINYDKKGDTTAVTSGNSSELHTCVISRTADFFHEFNGLILLAKELECILKNENLDIEFAINEQKQVFLLQVRPLILSEFHEVHDIAIHRTLIKEIQFHIGRLSKPHPYLHGKKAIFGVMPDWNPAEIIGIRPRPLALTLYKELITDSIWAYQRDNYGYKNLRSFPLLIDFMGLPYIDVRVSFNSFLPKELESSIADKLVDYYLLRLEQDLSLHDKVEFSIVFSCFTFDLDERMKILKNYQFSDSEIFSIREALKSITGNIIHKENGLWIKDIGKIEELQRRREVILHETKFDEPTKIYWLLEDCKRYGTLPFAGLARAGFIAMQLLDSLVTVGALTPHQKALFLNSLNTVSSQMTHDLATLGRSDFLNKYGHLRPGTYDILSPRYDEAYEIYFDWEKIKQSSNSPYKKEEFALSLSQLQKIDQLLKHNKLDYDVVGLFDFIKGAIEGREYSKFIFTRTLSDVLQLLGNFSSKNNITLDDISYLDIKDFIKSYSSSWNLLEEVHCSILSGKEKFRRSSQINLPTLLLSPSDVEYFHFLKFKPNFITNKSVTAPTHLDLKDTVKMSGSILFIPSADPGYDWIFTRNIAGFVTMYGGVNSHMAIRAAELGLPAIIGAGEKNYKQWLSANTVHIDCMNEKVEVLH